MPNLSLQNIAATLAALGTSAVVVACTKAPEPASMRADQAPTASATSASPPPPPPIAAPEQERGKDNLKATGSAAPPLQQPKPMRPAPTSGGGSTGQASCGAGTCTGDPKKK